MTRIFIHWKGMQTRWLCAVFSEMQKKPNPIVRNTHGSACQRGCLGLSIDEWYKASLDTRLTELMDLPTIDLSVNYQHNLCWFIHEWFSRNDPNHIRFTQAESKRFIFRIRYFIQRQKKNMLSNLWLHALRSPTLTFIYLFIFNYLDSGHCRHLKMSEFIITPNTAS